MDYQTEYAAGVYDATHDIEKHGIGYAQNLVDGLDTGDPYIAGYAATVNANK